MGSYSVGEALNLLMEKSHWKPKVNEMRMRDEWETIVGRTISKYTRNISLYNRVLTIYSDVAPLKQELQLGREMLVKRINEHFGEHVVDDIAVK